MPLNDRQVFAKLKKLLALADDSDSHESKTARAKADAMMAEFKLTLAEVKVGRRNKIHGSQPWFADIARETHSHPDRALQALINAHASIESVGRGIARTAAAIDSGDIDITDPAILKQTLSVLCKAHITSANAVCRALEQAILFTSSQSAQNAARDALIKTGDIMPPPNTGFFYQSTGSGNFGPMH